MVALDKLPHLGEEDLWHNAIDCYMYLLYTCALRNTHNYMYSYNYTFKHYE